MERLVGKKLHKWYMCVDWFFGLGSTKQQNTQGKLNKCQLGVLDVTIMLVGRS